MIPLSWAVADAAATVGMAMTRGTGLAGNVGFCWPKVPPASASMSVVPSWLSLALRSPLALSVSPTAPTMAATPTIGPSMISSVRTLRAVSPAHATPRRSRRRLTPRARLLPGSPHQLPALVADHPAVVHRHHAGGRARDAEVVGHHDDGPVVGLQG